MILLNKEQIKYLHSKMIQETGGSNGIRDEGLLDSALSAPFQSFGGMELYPSMVGKAARLCYGLIKNHAFFDADVIIGTRLENPVKSTGLHSLVPIFYTRKGENGITVFQVSILEPYIYCWPAI